MVAVHKDEELGVRPTRIHRTKDFLHASGGGVVPEVPRAPC